MKMWSEDFAILNKLTELHRRFGLKLSESHSSYGEQNGQFIIEYPNAPVDEPASSRFGQLMGALGIDPDVGLVVRDSIDELDALLDEALSKAPRARIR